MLVRLLAIAAAQRAPEPSLLAAATFTDNPGWPPLQKALDAVPMFTVANQEGARRTTSAQHRATVLNGAP